MSAIGGISGTVATGPNLTLVTRFGHGRPIFAVTPNTAPQANDVVGYGCRYQAVPLTFAPSVAIRSRRSEAFSLQGIVNIAVVLRGHSEWQPGGIVLPR